MRGDHGRADGQERVVERLTPDQRLDAVKAIDASFNNIVTAQGFVPQTAHLGDVKAAMARITPRSSGSAQAAR
jgi:hypothetical protein